MARLRAVVTLPWTTGLPEDVSINVFHFLTATTPSTAGERTNIAAALIAFYTTDYSGAATSLGTKLSPLIDRGANKATIEFFDLDDAPPRQPIDLRTFTVPASSSTGILPTEVALCMSFQALPISGVPQSRRRGRVYLGPWNSPQADTTLGRPVAALVTAIVLAGIQLKASAIAGTVPWQVYSRVGDALGSVNNGWVDNEWDTMRSRGRLATSRSLIT